ncbi:MAG: histidinol-phosphate transaminase [bacterium]
MRRPIEPDAVDLSGERPGVVARRSFLGLLGAGLAAASMPGQAAAVPVEPDRRIPEGFRRGDGSFTDPPVIQDPAAVQLDQNENPLAPSVEERRALADALELANRYPDAEGRLVRRLADHHSVDPDSILMGCGSTEMLKVCPDAVMGRGTEMVQAFPTYPTIDRYARVRGGKVISVPVDEEGRADLAAMRGEVSRRTRILYLCNPNNPTGRIIPVREMERTLAEVGPKTLIVVDEAYHEFVDHPEYESMLSRAAGRPGLVVLRTFSKVYGLAGMRVGYAVGHIDTIEGLRPHRLVLNLNNPAIFAAMAALDDAALQVETVEMNRSARESLQREIPSFGGRPLPSQAGFVWADFGRPTRPIRDALAERHVYVRTYRHSPRHLRISTGMPEQLTVLYEAMEQVIGG